MPKSIICARLARFVNFVAFRDSLKPFKRCGKPRFYVLKVKQVRVQLLGTLTADNVSLPVPAFVGRTVRSAISSLDLADRHTGVNPAGDAGDTSPIFWLGDVNGNIPPILLRTFGYSRPILAALRSLSLKPISFGYKQWCIGEYTRVYAVYQPPVFLTAYTHLNYHK